MFDRSKMFKSSTDQDGTYRITGIPAGRYNIIVFAPTHVQERTDDGNGKPVSVAEGQTIEGIDFNLEPGGVITGTVTDASGRAVIREFVTVVVIDKSGDKVPWTVGAQDRSMFLTDDRGVYRIYGVPEGRYMVSAGGGSPPGYNILTRRRNTQRTFHPGVIEESKAKILEVAAGTELSGIDIRMAAAGRGYSATGRISDSQTGKTVPGVILFSNRTSNDPAFGAGQPVTASSNAQGEFRFDNLSPGRYMAGLIPTGQTEFYSENILFEIKNDDLHGLEIKVQRGGSLEGTITVENSTGPDALESLASLFINASVHNPEMRGFSFGRGKINPDASFRVTGLAPGKVQLMVQDYLSPNPLKLLRIERDGVEQPDGITIGPGETITGVRLVLAQATGSIRGRVVLENGPLPSNSAILVMAFAAGKDKTGSPDTNQEVRPDGSFVLSRLVPGDYELEFFLVSRRGDDDSEHTLLRQAVTVNAGGPTEVTVNIRLKGKDRE
jgi:hypothetical protein